MLEATVRDNQELSQLIQQATSKREAITLVQEGQQKAVLLSLEMFQALIGISDRRENLLAKGFTAMSHQLFTKSGYDSPDKIMQLIQEVKQELATEREQCLKWRKNQCLVCPNRYFSTQKLILALVEQTEEFQCLTPEEFLQKYVQ